MTMNNVDDILHNTNKVDKVEPIVDKVEHMVEETVDVSPQENNDEPERLTHLEKFKRDKEEFLKQESEEDVQNEEKVEEKRPDKAESSKEIDEYGNEVAKKRVYTEDEVQKMIRDRLSRGRHADQAVQQTQQQVQQAAQDFKADPGSEESWENQLESFVKQTLHKVSQETHAVQIQEQERRIQADFETRFTSGMDKFEDFSDIVGGKPITNSMMMAARSMVDPASFIYAAAKQQAGELDRISKIPDPYQQAAEMGRLEERMRKAKTVSKAPRPITKTKSDMSEKYEPKPSIDNLILHHAKNKRR